MNNQGFYYTGPERRHAKAPRRLIFCRRHRIRRESLVTDCRQTPCRRQEDVDGYIELSTLYDGENQSQRPPHTEK